MQKPYLQIDELADLMGMSPKSVLNSIHRERFPIPTYRLGKQRVADREVVDTFFKNKRDLGLSLISTI